MIFLSLSVNTKFDYFRVVDVVYMYVYMRGAIKNSEIYLRKFSDGDVIGIFVLFSSFNPSELWWNLFHS